MALGRKKRKAHEEEPGLAHEEGPVDETAAADAPATAGEEPEAFMDPAYGSANGADAPPGDDFTEAAAPAGDPAAAGVDAEGPGAELRTDTATFEVAGATDAPTPAPGESGRGAETLGSAAASPDDLTAPAADPDAYYGASSSGDGGPGAKAGAAAGQAQSFVESRPEVLVAGAFAAGVVVARVLAALGRDE